MLQTPNQVAVSNFVYGVVNREMEFSLGQGIIGLWPGNLVHRTETNKTGDDRVSLSFNVRYER